MTIFYKTMGNTFSNNRKIHPHLFLDIDGVLNCAKNRTEDRASHLPEDELLNNLKMISDSIPNLIIILSSTWRLTQNKRNQVDEALSKVGLKVFGYTPDKSLDCSGDRPDEIFEYINEHGLVNTPWVAIDDMAMIQMNSSLQSINFCQTDDMDGLTTKKANEVITKIRCQMN
jgi:hypothetical protein